MDQTVRQVRKVATVHDHIRELVVRIVVSSVAFAIAGVMVYVFYEPLLSLLRSPLGAPLYYNSPAGSFSFVIKICTMGALTIALPVLVYNLVMFIRPAYSEAITLRRVYLTTLFSSLLAVAGAIFAFTVILPGSLNFFAGFRVNGLSALISADSYLGFVTSIIVTFVIVFQIPLIIAFIDRIKPIQPKKLIKMEKWVVIGSLVVAILAPFTYDLVTSILIAMPIIVLYNVSIVMVVFRHAKIARREHSSVHAVIAKPIALMPDLAVNAIVYETIADELLILDKPKPRVISNYAPDNAYLDLKPKTVQETVQPAAWVEERKARREAVLAAQVHVFSDISTNRRLSMG